MPLSHPIAIVDGLEATPILNMCLRYQEHLSTVASVMANEQVSEMTLVYGTPFSGHLNMGTNSGHVK